MMLKAYYDKVKSHAVDVIAAATGMKVENCWHGVHEALIDALRDGTYRTAAVVLRATNVWDWANEESEEETYKCSMGLKDCHGGDAEGQADHPESGEQEGHAEAAEAAKAEPAKA